MATAWRITSNKHLATALAGLGARRFGGRWNRPGTSVVYASTTLPLAMLEILVHLPNPRHLAGHSCARAQIPEQIIHRPPRLPRRWDRDEVVSQQFGEQWLRQGEWAVLEVPSIVYRCALHEPRNLLINAEHPDYRRIAFSEFVPLRTDARLQP